LQKLQMLSLHARIFAAIALICAVALIGVGMYSTRVTFLQIESMPSEAAAAKQHSGPVERAIEAYVKAHPRFDSVQPFLHDLAQRTNTRIVLLTPALRVIATSFPSNETPAVARAGTDTLRVSIRQNGAVDDIYLRGGIPVRARGGDVVAYFFTFAQPAAPSGLSVAHSANRAVWMSIMIALFAALAVGILLSRYIVGPVRELTAAAGAMARGDLKRRVRARGSDDVGRLAASFNAMADAVERTEHARRRMVTDVAHELRSPLTRMRAQLEAAQDGHMPASDALPAVYAETLALEQLVDDLRDLSLADAGKLHVEKTTVALDACIDTAIARITADARARGITVVRDVGPGLPGVSGDPARMRQILANLLDNALRYTPAGGHIILGAAAADRFVEFFVQDDGPGIDAADAASLFERFYRVDGSRSRGTGGSGLGLAIAKELTELQGGTIAVESTPGAGSRFTCRFPRQTTSSSP